MNSTMKRAIILLSVALAITSICIPAFTEGDASVLTLMVYVTGSDLESTSGAATSDITEMMRSGVDTEKVNIILCTGGAKRWQGGFPNDHVCIYQVEGRRPRQLESYDLISMGEASTLTTFLDYSYEHFPADQYALILWDHGGGPMNGVCFDELFSKNNTHDSLDLSELRTALSDSPFNSKNPLEWIGFDACLMSSVETANICASFAKYMIASQETEPGTGWDYSFLKQASEGLSGDEMGKLIVEAYTDDSHASDLMLTLSCIDLSQMGNVEAATDYLFSNLNTILTSEHYSEISNSRRDAKSYGRASTASEYDLVDLFSLAEQFSYVAADSVNALKTALESAIVYYDGNQENSHGLSIYYPYYNKVDYEKNWGEQYSKWGFADGYKEFVKQYTYIWLGEQLTDWTDVRATALPPSHESQEITLQLTHQQDDNYASAQLFILGRMGSSEPYYYKVDEIDDVRMDNDRILHADYKYKALYVVGSEGKPICGAVPYEIVDGYYLIRANLSDITWDTYWDDYYSVRKGKKEINMNAKKVYLQCVPNSAGDGLDVVGVIDLLEALGDGINGLLVEGEGLYTGKQTIISNMETWNWVWFFNFPRAYQTDQDGNVLAYQNWTNPNVEGNGFLSIGEIDNHEHWELRFLENQYYDEDLYAQYIIRDTQGNLQGSNLIPINNPNRIHVATLDDTLYENDSFSIKTKGIDLCKTEYENSIIIKLGLTDRRKALNDIQITAQNVVLDRCFLNKSYEIIEAPMKEGEVDYILRIPTEDMPIPLRNMISTISFDVTINDRTSGNTIYEFAVTIVQDIDLSPIRSDSDEVKAIADILVGDIRYELISMEETDDYIELTFFVENDSKEHIEDSWRDTVFINGFEWQAAVESIWFDLPADCWTLTDIKIYKLSLHEKSRINANRVTQYSYAELYGIDQIDRMEFIDWNDELIDITLETPFILNRTRTGSSRSAKLAHSYDDIIEKLKGYEADLSEIASYSKVIDTYTNEYGPMRNKNGETDFSKLYLVYEMYSESQKWIAALKDLQQERASMLSAMTSPNGGLRILDGQDLQKKQTKIQDESFYTELNEGARGLEVMRLQKRLNELGFYSTSINGEYNTDTVYAIKRFQEYNGLEITGIASPILQVLLFSEDALGNSDNNSTAITSVDYNINYFEGTRSSEFKSLAILKTEDVTVTVVCYSVKTNNVRIVLDMINTSEKTIQILPHNASINGISCDCRLEKLNSTLSTCLFTQEILPGHKKRLAYSIQYDDNSENKRIEIVNIGFEYVNKGSLIWNYCTPAELRIKNDAMINEMNSTSLDLSTLDLVSEGSLMDNTPVNPLSLVGVKWMTSNDVQSYQTVLSVPLSSEQVQKYESANVMLMLPWENNNEDTADMNESQMLLLSSIGSAELTNDNMLTCLFSGLLIGVEGTDMPLAHNSSIKGDKYTFDIRGVELLTDHSDIMNNAIYMDKSKISFYAEKINEIEKYIVLSRPTSKAERKVSAYCVLDIYTSKGEETGERVHDNFDIDSDHINLLILPAENYDPIVMFCIKNTDGSEYTLQTNYQKAK